MTDLSTVKFLTVHEIAEELRRGDRTVWRWVAEGKLPSIKVGGVRMVTIEAYRAFLARSEKLGRVT